MFPFFKIQLMNPKILAHCKSANSIEPASVRLHLIIVVVGVAAAKVFITVISLQPPKYVYNVILMGRY